MVLLVIIFVVLLPTSLIGLSEIFVEVKKAGFPVLVALMGYLLVAIIFSVAMAMVITGFVSLIAPVFIEIDDMRLESEVSLAPLEDGDLYIIIGERQLFFREEGQEISSTEIAEIVESDDANWVFQTYITKQEKLWWNIFTNPIRRYRFVVPRGSVITPEEKD